MRSVSLNHQSLYLSTILRTSLAPGIKMFLFKLSDCFKLALEKKLQNMVEKIFCLKKGEKKTQHFTISVSRFTQLEGKKETLLKADVDTVSVIEDGKSSLKPSQLQRNIDGS